MQVLPERRRTMLKMGQQELMGLLIQLAIMLFAGRMLAEVARKLKQPAVVGEIIAGLLLGPTVLGLISPDTFQLIFPEGPSSLVLDGFVQVAVVMLLFIAGLEVDLHVVWQQGRQAVLTSTLGLVVPFALGFALPFLS